MRSAVKVRPLHRVQAVTAHGVSSERVDLVPALLTLTVRSRAGRALPSGRAETLVLVLEGDLCAYTVAEVQPLLERLALDTIDLRLDLADVTLVGAAAVRLFIDLDAVLGAHGGRLRLQGPTPLARRVLELTGIADLLAPPSPHRAGDDRPPESPPSPGSHATRFAC